MEPELPVSKRFLPISEYQDEVTSIWNELSTTDFFREYTSIKWAFLVKPRADERRIRRAFNKLTERHDSLRLRFVEFPSGYKAEIQSKHPTGLIVEDFGEMDHNDMMREVNNRAQRLLSVFDDALFQMHLLRFGKMGDVVLTHVHHAVVDGYSIVLLIEELLKHALSLPVMNKPIGHAEFIAHRLRELKKVDKDNILYWEEELLPVASPMNIGRVAKGLPPLTGLGELYETVQIPSLFSKPEATALSQISQESGYSHYSYMFAAFSDVICEESGSDHALINCIIGRKDAALSSFIGPEMQSITLNIPYSPNQSIHEKAKIVSRKIREGADHSPTNAFRKNGAIDKSFHASGRRRNQFLVHIPQSPGRIKNSPFSNLFYKAMAGKVSFGLITIERLDLEKTNFTNFELSLTMEEGSDGLVAMLSSDKMGFGIDDLNRIRNKLADKLFSTSDHGHAGGNG